MQNIHVRRYKQPAPGGFQGTVEPEDRSWVIFIDKEGHATFWRRGELDVCSGPHIENMGTEITREIWYDVESVMLPSEAEEPTEGRQQSASQ